MYESENFLVSARDTYLQLLPRYPRIRLPEVGAGDAARATSSSAELARPPLAQIASDRPRPPLPLPLARRWHIQSGNGRTVRVARRRRASCPACSPAAPSSSRGPRLGPLDPATGEPRWTVEMGTAPVLGRLSRGQGAGRDLAAGGGARARRPGPSSGVSPGAGRAAAGRPPTRSPAPSPRRPGRRRARSALHDFQLVGGRLFCLRGEQELLAHRRRHRAARLVLLRRRAARSARSSGSARSAGRSQVQKPNQLLVLETDSGRQVARTPLADGEALERPPVPIDDDHVLLVPDRRTVKNSSSAAGSSPGTSARAARCRSTAPRG